MDCRTHKPRQSTDQAARPTAPDAGGTAGGFTLIEVMIAVAIVGILASLAVPTYTDFLYKARIARAIAEDKNLFTIMTDFYGYAGANNSFAYTANDIVFLGYGIDDSSYSDYKNVDVKGKIVLIAAGEPMVNGKSVITGSDSLSAWSKDWRKKAAAATSNGVMCLLTIDPMLAEVLSNPQWKNFLEGSILKLQSEYKQPEYTNNLFISQNMADK